MHHTTPYRERWRPAAQRPPPRAGSDRYSQRSRRRATGTTQRLKPRYFDATGDSPTTCSRLRTIRALALLRDLRWGVQRLGDHMANRDERADTGAVLRHHRAAPTI